MSVRGPTTLYCIVFYLYIYIAHQSEALPVREIQREESSRRNVEGAHRESKELEKESRIETCGQRQ